MIQGEAFGPLPPVLGKCDSLAQSVFDHSA
jgi:hypothetical protein